MERRGDRTMSACWPLPFLRSGFRVRNKVDERRCT
jgi:hypothetical protein